MENIKLSLDGAFLYKKDGKRLGMLRIKVDDGVLTAESTEVNPEVRGKGIAGELFDQMIDFVRKNNLKIVSHCSYIDARLNRNPEEYQQLLVRHQIS